MKGKQPAILLYTGDWLKDPKLSLCTPATRGIFIDLLCAMHESDRSGQISGTRDQLARVARCTAVDIGHAVDELKSTNAADVTVRNDFVTVRNRRMWREAKERNQIRLRVSNHREKRSCNGKLTTPLSSSSSISSSKTPEEEDHVLVSDSKPDPANILARACGAGPWINPENRALLSRLIAIDGYDCAKSALDLAISKKGPGKKAIQYAIGIAQNQKTEGNGQHKAAPISSLKDRPRSTKYAS